MSAELMRRNRGERTRWFSPENPAGRPGEAGLDNAGWKGRAFVALAAGDELTLAEMSGPGRITRVWLTTMQRTPEVLAGVRVRAYWDHAPVAAVDVPLGDFFLFATGHMVPFSSELFSSPEGRSFVTTVPMPFAQAARLTLVNDSSTDISHVFYEVDVVETAAAEADLLWFHTRHTVVDRSPLDRPMQALPQVRGAGRLLGLSIGVRTAPEYGQLWFGEGEVRMRIDDVPGWTLSGTGLEDHIGSGWTLGTYAHQEQGCLVADPERGVWSMYRFHLSDPVWFDRSLAVDLQTIGGGPHPEVLAAEVRGASLRRISLDVEGVGFRGLMGGGGRHEEAGSSSTWTNFARSDSYRVTAFLALDRPAPALPR